MADQVSVTVNVAGALARLGEVLRASQDLSPVLAGPVNEIVDEYFRKQFDSEGRFAGTPWAPHRPVTKKLRARRGHGRGGILRDTNRLWASLTKLGLGPDAIKRVTPRLLERGTTVRHALFHQTGFVMRITRQGIPRFQRVPARPIVPDQFPSEIVQAWEQAIVKFLTREQAA